MLKLYENFIDSYSSVFCYLDHFEKCREKYERLKISASVFRTNDTLFSKAKKNHAAQQLSSLEPDIQNIEDDFSDVDDV